jgi:hypothetical protein
MLCLCYLYLVKYTGVHIRLCLCRLTVTWQVSHMEQELLIFPEHLHSPPVFSGFCVTQYLVFYVMFCRSLFVLFLVAIVMFVLLLITPLVSSNFSYQGWFWQVNKITENQWKHSWNHLYSLSKTYIVDLFRSCPASFRFFFQVKIADIS